MTVAAQQSSASGTDRRHPSGSRQSGAVEPSWPPLAVAAFATVVFVIASGAFVTLVSNSSADGESGPLFQVLWAVAYLFAAAVLLDGALRSRLRPPRPPALLFFVALTAVSTSWSVAPDLTLRRSVGLLGTVLVGLVIAQRLPPVEIFEALRRAMLFVAVVSLILYVAGSPLAVDEVHQTLRGILVTKNTMGRYMALGLLACVATALLDRSRARRGVLSAVPILVALALTGSSGGIVVAAMVVLVGVVVLLCRSGAGSGVLAAGSCLVVGVAVAVLPRTTLEQVTGLIGEDATLTGRTDIWVQALEAIAARPLLGYGYGAFWDSEGAAARILARLEWEVPNAHNGLLDMALELGIIGAVAALVVVGGLAIRGLVDLHAGRGQAAALRLSIAGLIVLSNIVETGLLGQNNLTTVLLVAAIAGQQPPPLTPGVRGPSATLRQPA